MSVDMSSYEAEFVSRVDAMELAMRSSRAMPVNPILAAQKIIDASDARPRPGLSPLHQEVTSSECRLEAPMLKRNYGSLSLSTMSTSSSSSGSSLVSTPTEVVFPIHCTKSTENGFDLIEQDISPPSSAPGSPVLEFSTRRKTNTKIQELQPFGIMFGRNLAPEFVPADEVSDYLDFMGVLEDCDSLGQFAQAPEIISSNITPMEATRPYSSIQASGSNSALGLCLDYTQRSLLVHPDDFSTPDLIKLDSADLKDMDHLLSSPKPAFSVTSPRIAEGAWGLESPIFDSVAFESVASPTIGSGSFDVISWMPTILSLALVANVVMGSVC